jgi:hypothetical protein
MKTSKEMIKHPIVKRNKSIKRILYLLQLIGFVIPLFFPLWVMVFYEVILFMAHDYFNDLFNRSVLIVLMELAEFSKMLNKRL